MSKSGNRSQPWSKCVMFAIPVAVVDCIYVQRFSTYSDVAAGAVLVSMAALVVLCPLLIWLANASRF